MASLIQPANSVQSPRTAQHREIEVGVGEVDVSKVGTSEVGSRQIGSRKIGVGKIGKWQKHLAQIRLREVGASKISTR